MPNETAQAVDWALQQDGISADEPWMVVDKVREYFNTNSIVYNSFSFDDLIPYIN